MTQTNYHIHVDGFTTPQSYIEFVKQLGFKDTSFTDALPGVPCFVPTGPSSMYTYRTEAKAEFEQRGDKLVAGIEKTGFEGYLEGE